MIQFNLLPDVKKEYIKARRTKRLITSAAMVAIVVSLVVVGIMLSVVQFGQKKHINDLTVDIADKVQEINEIEDLDKILTIQNQIQSLESLHQQKPETSRLFDYFTQLTPTDATISNLQVDLVEGTLKITGAAKDIATVNKFADTLKFTKFTSQPLSEVKVGDDGKVELVQEGSDQLQEIPMFTSVLTQVSRSDTDTSYILETTFDLLVFDNTQYIVLRVPDIVTTRSVLNKPDIGQNGLFNDTEIDIESFNNGGGN